MNILYGDVFDEVVEAMRAGGSVSGKAKAGRRLNSDYQALAIMESWAEMRRKIEITYSGSAVQLPSDLLGIDLVWDDTYDIEYLGRTRDGAEHDEQAYRYYTYPVGSTLAVLNDVSVNQDGTTFVSTGLETLADAGQSYDEEYFYVDGEDQLYKITSRVADLFTFTPAFRGIGNRTSASMVVRPPTTLMLDIVAPEGSTSPTGVIDVHYWKKPNTLRDPMDQILLPTSDALILRSLSRLPESKPHRPVTMSMAMDAMKEAMGLNPSPPRPRLARGLNGRPFTASDNLYATRSSVRGHTSRVLQNYQNQ